MLSEPRAALGTGGVQSATSAEAQPPEAEQSGADGATTLPQAEQRAPSLVEDNLKWVKRLRDGADGLRSRASRLRDQAENFRENGEEGKAKEYMAEAKEYMAEAKEYMAEAEKLEDRAKEYMAEAEKYLESRAKDLPSTCSLEQPECSSGESPLTYGEFKA